MRVVVFCCCFLKRSFILPIHFIRLRIVYWAIWLYRRFVWYFLISLLLFVLRHFFVQFLSSQSIRQLICNIYRCTNGFSDANASLSTIDHIIWKKEKSSVLLYCIWKGKQICWLWQKWMTVIYVRRVQSTNRFSFAIIFVLIIRSKLESSSSGVLKAIQVDGQIKDEKTRENVVDKGVNISRQI